ncbi:hypothetical protein G9444_3854 [Rhodococcus erythropolis]|uniref:AAA domain-containing protein n=1 Tax=Rhodococcus erythropolis TaxID=1833 RepID=A0A6G9CW25_RHOER|nr:hypothetical protein [Rhodococcus erythropolis]QIP41098.1 hypothetical protein G9444_3854 [Rhodococcus erythropolis]
MNIPYSTDSDEWVPPSEPPIDDGAVPSSGIGGAEPRTIRSSAVLGTVPEPYDQQESTVPSSAPYVREPGTAPELTTVPSSGTPMWEPGTNPYADVAAMLDGTLPEPPKPMVLRRSDGKYVFYDGQVNWVFGDPEGGKTWVCLACASEALNAGKNVIVIDLDHNGARGNHKSTHSARCPCCSSA